MFRSAFGKAVGIIARAGEDGAPPEELLDKLLEELDNDDDDERWKTNCLQ